MEKTDRAVLKLTDRQGRTALHYAAGLAHDKEGDGGEGDGDDDAAQDMYDWLRKFGPDEKQADGVTDKRRSLFLSLCMLVDLFDKADEPAGLLLEPRAPDPVLPLQPRARGAQNRGQSPQQVRTWLAGRENLFFPSGKRSSTISSPLSLGVLGGTDLRPRPSRRASLRRADAGG